MEADDIARTIKSRISLGIIIIRKHDDKWRLTNMVMTDKYDTLTFKQYIWHNGRLIKTIFDGVERNFIYGKTLQDTIRVIPSDTDVALFHSGFNNSIGMMPNEKNYFDTKEKCEIARKAGKDEFNKAWNNLR